MKFDRNFFVDTDAQITIRPAKYTLVKL
jgi:hypothetical protein